MYTVGLHSSAMMCNKILYSFGCENWVNCRELFDEINVKNKYIPILFLYLRARVLISTLISQSENPLKGHMLLISWLFMPHFMYLMCKTPLKATKHLTVLHASSVSKFQLLFFEFPQRLPFLYDSTMHDTGLLDRCQNSVNLRNTV